MLTVEEVRQIRAMIKRLEGLLPLKQQERPATQRLTYEFSCIECGRKFTAHRKEAVYCGNTCRRRTFIARKERAS